MLYWLLMSKKTVLLLIIAIILVVLIIRTVFTGQKNYFNNPRITEQEPKTEIVLSKTLKTYTDPSGFAFSYPDNLSLINNEITDPKLYADLKLTAKGALGSLALKITESKFNKIEDWVKTNQATASSIPKEASLGNLKALEITTNGKLLLGALDSGVLFNIDLEFGDKKDLWVNVYKKVLEDFSFVSPNKENAVQGGTDTSDSVVFEEEETVE